jgi:hypothetical protein
MSRSSLLIAAALALVVLGASAAQAQQIALLTEKYTKKLNEKALATYQEGAKAYDHVNFDLAIKRLHEAMKQDPKHIKLRLLVARFAYERAKVKMGEEAIRLLAIAEEALTALIERKDLKPEDRRRAETDLAEVQRAAKGLTQRDTLRETAGKAIIEDVIKEREQMEGKALPTLGLKSGSEENDTASSSKKGKGSGKGSGKGQSKEPPGATNPNSSQYM